MTLLSVIVCTHNPRMEYLQQTLRALSEQSIDQDLWELLVIDNVSDPPLAGRIDLSWHEAARLIREDHLGLTAARQRGIAESSAELLVFVDDDNVLEPDYLQTAQSIGRDWPRLGVWGGQALPCFEQDPPAWATDHLPRLALRTLDREIWSNLRDRVDLLPAGAGMCLRKEAARQYLKELERDPQRRQLDRRGTSLISAGDWDLALTALDAGYGCGLFPQLKLTHLIPKERTTEDYLLRLTEAQEYSGVLLLASRGSTAKLPVATGARRLLNWWRERKLSDRERRFAAAIRNGRAKAYEELASNGAYKT